MQVTSIELPDELYRKTKHRAVDDSTSFKAVVQRALEEYLDKLLIKPTQSGWGRMDTASTTKEKGGET